MVVKVRPKPILIILGLIATLLLVMGFLWLYLVSPVDKDNDEKIKVEIKTGTSTSRIAEILKEKDIIRSENLFKMYIKFNKVNSLKASTYRLSKSMSLAEIVEILEDGHVADEDVLKLTFKPGERITDYAKTISEKTNNNYDDIINLMKDRNYIKELISNYWFLTDAILNENIYYPLEGYLEPDTYYYDNKDVSIKVIIKSMLDESEKTFNRYKNEMINDPHYYVTMASIIQLEGTNLENRKNIVGVFKNRINSGYNLGSDVTTYYALQKDMKNDLTSKDFATINPYNTRAANMIGKMPVGPICGFDETCIKAAIYPYENDYLFFVADKHGNIYFTKTNAEHDKKVAEIKERGDWIF